nr:hypothetical protein GCM10020093_022870 [Planobispora longispora]
MGANHSHGPVVPHSRATVWATLAVIIPLAIATLAALVWMWPAEPVSTAGQPQLERVTGTITDITLTPVRRSPHRGGAAEHAASRPRHLRRRRGGADRRRAGR